MRVRFFLARNIHGRCLGSDALVSRGAHSQEKCAILVTAIGVTPVWVGTQFTAGCKLGCTRQTVLVFGKRDPRNATEAIGSVEFGAIAKSNDDCTDNANPEDNQ